MKHQRACLVLAIATVVLSSCSAASTASAIDTGTPKTLSCCSQVLPANTIPSLVLSGKDIQLFDSQYQEQRQIKRPYGWVAIDKLGDIYYEARNYGTYLEIFKPPYNRKPLRISFESVGDLYGIAVDWKRDIYAVVTAPPAPDWQAAVSFFRVGATKPCAVLQAPSGWFLGSEAAFDADGRLFLNNESGVNATLLSVSGECAATTFTQYGGTLPQVFALQFNSEDQLVLQEYKLDDTARILTYPHPKNGQIGSPISTTILNHVNGKMPSMLTLTSNGTQLWASTFYQLYNSNGVVALYNYPAGGDPVKVLNITNVWGAAVYPQLTP